MSFYSLHSTEVLRKLYEEEQFDHIIADYLEHVESYPPKAIFYIGLAFFMKADDNNCLKYMNLSLEKVSSDPDVHFFKGLTLGYSGQYEQAISSLSRAIELNPDASNYYSALGDVYFNQKAYDDALHSYQSAVTKTNPSGRPFSMIPQIYVLKNEPSKALKAFYDAKDHLSKDSEEYITVLYNIGLSEFLDGRYEKAESAYKELVAKVPTDYHSVSKLVQVYYGMNHPRKAIPYKKRLYDAYHRGKLKGDLSEEFCFDQFRWGQNLVFAFERFEEPHGELFYKHIFKVISEENIYLFQVQTENSPILEELGEPFFMLGMDRNGSHSTFPVRVPKGIDYSQLKMVVLEVLEEKIKASASSRPD